MNSRTELSTPDSWDSVREPPSRWREGIGSGATALLAGAAALWAPSLWAQTPLPELSFTGALIDASSSNISNQTCPRYEVESSLLDTIEEGETLALRLARTSGRAWETGSISVDFEILATSEADASDLGTRNSLQNVSVNFSASSSGFTATQCHHVDIAKDLKLEGDETLALRLKPKPGVYTVKAGAGTRNITLEEEGAGILVRYKNVSLGALSSQRSFTVQMEAGTLPTSSPTGGRNCDFLKDTSFTRTIDMDWRVRDGRDSNYGAASLADFSLPSRVAFNRGVATITVRAKMDGDMVTEDFKLDRPPQRQEYPALLALCEPTSVSVPAGILDAAVFGVIAPAESTPAPPAKPTGLSATAGDRRVTLSWDDPGNDSITDYQFQQQKGTGSWSGWMNITGSDADTTSHPVIRLENGSLYNFRIRAQNDGGNSPTSDPASATPIGETFSVPATLTVAEGAGNAVVRVTASEILGDVMNVTLNVTYGSTSVTTDTDATGAANPADGDYDNDAVTSVTFSSTDPWKNITIPITDDGLDEPDETFTVTIAAATTPLPGGFTLGNATTTVTITDNDDPPVLSIAAPEAVTEGDSGSTNMVFTVTLDSTSAKEVTVDYGVDAASTATSGTDHATLANGRLTFPAGTATQTITVSVTGDELDEQDETVVIKLSNAVNATLGTDTATGTITDDDASPVLDPIDDVNYRVGQTVDITAVASDADGDTVSYAWSRKGGESTPAIPDGTAQNQAQLTFAPPGTGTYTMTVTASDGNGNTATEEVIITVSNANVVSVPERVEVGEEEGNAEVTITTTGAFGASTTFNVTYGSTSVTTDTDATGAADPANGDYDNDAVTSVTFAASETTKDITIPITNDGLDEPDETFTVTIAPASSLPGGFILGRSTTTVTITDDDTSPVLEPIDDVNYRVGQTVDITAVASDADGDTVSYAWSRKEGESTPAIPDGTAQNQAQLTFTAAETGIYTMTVTASDGNGNTATEEVIIMVSSANTVWVPETATVAEGDGQVTVAVRTTEAFGASTTFNVAYGSTSVTTDTDATGAPDPSNGDYDNDAVTSVTFSTSETTKAITIPITDDGLDEPDETFTVTVAPASSLPGGFTLGTATTTVTITDNDEPPAAGGDPPSEEEEEDTPPVPAAADLTATAGNAQVTLTWTFLSDPTITRWQVQQKQSGGAYGPWRDVPNSDASTRTHTVTGLTNGTTYSFKVRAVNPTGPGAPSNEATATPVDPDAARAAKARKQAVAATSRTLLGMATDVLGARTGRDCPAPVPNSLGEQALGIVEDVLGINGSELPTDLTLAGIEDRLWSQSFQLTPPPTGGTPQDREGKQPWCPSGQQGSWALWGAGTLGSYQVNDNDNDDAEGLSSSGNVKTAWLGVDHRFTDPWLAGLAFSFGSAESDYSYLRTDGSTGGGRMSAQLTTFYPYGAVQLNEQLRLWGMAGTGWGSQQHRHSQGDQRQSEGDLRLHMGVIGFERALDSIGDLNLSLAGDAGLVKSTTEWKAGSGLDDVSVSLHRIRLGIDSSFPLAEHTTGYLNLKGRLDGGDLEMEAAEIVAGLQYSRERFSGFLQGRQVYAFDGSYAESGLHAQLNFTSRPDGTGLAWELQPSYGAGDGDVGLAAGPSLWTDQQMETLTGSGASQENREMALSGRVGYGIRLQPGDWLLTPFTEVHLWQGNSHRIGLGLTLEDNSWYVEFSGSTEGGGNASPTGTVELSFSKWL